MKSMFDMGLRKAFMPISTPVPMSGAPRRLGQESDWGPDWGPAWEPDWEQNGGLFTSYDQGPPAEDIPNLYTSYDQGPPAEDIPNLYTSYDQGPPSESVPGLVTWQDLQASSTADTDWSKFAQELVKGAGAGYGSYQQAQAKFNTERAKAGLPAMPLATAAAEGSSGLSPNVIFLVGGLAVAVIAAVALS